MSSDTQADLLSEAPSAVDDGAPTSIAGRFTVQAWLGSGGMGAVYRVHDRELDEVVALKMLRPELAGVPGLAARFRQEVKLARRVTHPNVVRTFDLGEAVGEDGVPRLFLTMELVDGRPLSQLLADGPLPLARGSAIVAAICAGLQAAHDASVLHRDLKPDNVLVTPGGRALLTDFGIASAANEVGSGAGGTPGYMAPEGVASAQADVYALGAVLFEVLTGARADVDGPDPRALRPDVAPALAAVVLRCLSPNPADRFATAAAVGAAWAVAAVAAPPAPTPLPDPLPAVPRASARTLAVLPFDAGGDDALSEGFAEELVDALSMTRGLRVRPVTRCAGEPLDAGRALGVEVVVHGALRRGDAGWQLRVRCLSVGDGFQVGAWRFTSPDPLAASDQVAAAVAHALTVDLEVPARRPAEAGDAARARALDLYFRGKRELRAHWFEPDAAAALLAEAHALAPDDPAVLAEHATAAARVASMAGARMASQNAAARALAERAVALAPERAEGWFALAVTHSTANRVTPAALAARAVLARSPGHLGAQELLGTILVEVGEPAAAVTRFRAVLASDPRSRVVGDLARAVALLGDWDGAVEVLRSQPEAGVAGLTWSRLRLWNPALPPPPPLPAAPQVPTLMREARQFYEALERGLVTDAVAEAALERLVLGHTGRMLAGLLQVSVEISVHLGDLPRSLRLLARAVDEGLVDRVWLDRCPVLAPLRAHGDYEGLARRVAERADAVLASLG